MNSLLAVTYGSNYNYSTSTSTEMNPAVLVLYLVVLVLMLASMWKVFTKAGKPGWAAIVPFYNIYIMLQIIGRPTWWLLLYFIPLVNLVISIIVSIDLAKAFGKSTLFGVLGLWIFSFVGYPMLGFGKATYQGARPTDLGGSTPPSAGPTTSATPQA